MYYIRIKFVVQPSGWYEEAPQDKVHTRGERDAQPDENGKTDGAIAHILFIFCESNIPKGADL